ncbi:MAG: universal stress protein [Caldilineaceae bacterium]
MQKHKVLIPLDGSTFSRQIFRAVREWFDPQAVTLVLLRVDMTPALLPETALPHRFVSDIPTGGLYAVYSEEMNENRALTPQQRQALLGEQQRELQADAEGLRTLGYTVSTEVHFGEPAQTIINLVNSESINLVAMTTHGRSGLVRLAMGSVAERVLRGVNVPVMLLRPALAVEQQPTAGALLAQSLDKKRPFKLAAATDGSSFGQKAVTLALELAKSLAAELTLFVTASERDSLEHNQKVIHDVAALMTDLAPNTNIVPLVGYADETLLQALEKNAQDLLILGAFRDRGAGSAKLIGTTAQRVVQYAPTSVLIVKERDIKLEKMLVCIATDDDVTLDVGSRLTKALNMQLKALHVKAGETPAPSVQIVQGWVRQLESQGFDQNQLQIKRGNVLETILDTAHTGAYDLVVVGSQSGAGDFLGSVANGVARFAEQSVLVVRTRT